MSDYIGPILAGIGTAAGISAMAYLAMIRPAREKVDRMLLDLEARERNVVEEAQAKRNALLIEAKEEILKQRERMESELREKSAALTKHEDRLGAKDEQLENRRTQLEEREYSLIQQAKEVSEQRDSIAKRLQAIEEELQQVAALDRDAARELFLQRIEGDFREAGAQKAKEIEAITVSEAEKKAKKAVLDVIQRHVVDYVTEATLAVVELPSEDMKGRIIGREGRNIRAFEQVTGVDLIIDETPEAVVISCFDPVRRETARIALMNLMVDGRIHPGRIEELYEKAQVEVARMVREAGEKAAERANIVGLSPKAIEMMGKLRFRTSYAQNVLDHSVEVSHLAGSLAHELGLNAEIAKRAGFLHDIGKGLGPEWEGPHALTGMEFLRNLGEKETILHAVGAHHYEIEPTTPEAILVIIADTISAARPGARRENLENYLKRLTALEALANSFRGVERSYAVQAGREIRLIINPTEVDDLGAMTLAKDVARQIEKEMEYPGQIKVTVIRETRVHDVAK